jgi:hypothetical protein
MIVNTDVIGFQDLPIDVQQTAFTAKSQCQVRLLSEIAVLMQA